MDVVVDVVVVVNLVVNVDQANREVHGGESTAERQTRASCARPREGLLLALENAVHVHVHDDVHVEVDHLG